MSRQSSKTGAIEDISPVKDSGKQEIALGNVHLLSENGKGKLILKRLLAKIEDEARTIGWSDWDAWDQWDR